MASSKLVKLDKSYRDFNLCFARFFSGMSWVEVFELGTANIVVTFDDSVFIFEAGTLTKLLFCLFIFWDILEQKVDQKLHRN